MGLLSCLQRAKWNLVVSAIIFSVSTVSAKPLNIPGSPEGVSLPIDLLNEVVKRSDIYTSIHHPYGEKGDSTFTKTVYDLNAGVLDLLWTATSTDYEQSLQAIYFPLYRGTLGMRLGIVRQQRLSLFSGVNSLADLRQFTACQGKMWADTQVLESNGVKVSKSLGYLNIFPMLEADRCDYFPRAIFEPWAEVKREAEYDLHVEPNIMLRYKMPFFFFVKAGNNQLAEHINTILYQMFEDGAYQALFNNDDDVKNALTLGHLSNRTIIDLENPNVSDKVKAIPEKIWFDPIAGNK
ncbi:ABC transporter substrate-binding protein [Shewanella sp. TC10]|uniref:ABC transporter substrate-binding protein n=1 Tax=Shewanella sp. TC10 TaxID=1419739 RepID=UPI00129EA4D6|nr:ABC transporter substrate-binding protein [Shewanella sp. TC10]